MENQELSNEIEKAILKIMWLSFKINRDTDVCVFMRMAGHVSMLEIELGKSKKEYNSRRIKEEIKYEKDGFYKDSKPRLDRLNEIIDFLEETLNSEGIDYTSLYPVYQEIVSHYEI